MPTAIELFFSISALLVLLVVVFLVDRVDRGDKDSAYWRGSREDLLRLLMANPDGTFRKRTKLVLGVMFALFVALIWALPGAAGA
jgi:uncharacterized ion transporter superfamily protein YfcC